MQSLVLGSVMSVGWFVCLEVLIALLACIPAIPVTINTASCLSEVEFIFPPLPTLFESVSYLGFLVGTLDVIWP